jgi:hypothetical protein
MYPLRRRPTPAAARRGRRRVAGGALLAALAALAAAAAGCAAGGPQPVAQPTGRATAIAAPATAEQATVARQRALAAYGGMWAAYDAAGRAPAADPDHPELAAYATGRALRVLAEGLTSLRQQGLVIEGQVVLHPKVVAVNPPSAPTEVRIEDCGDSTGWLTVDPATGQVTDEPRGRQMVFATVTDVGGGQWKVSDFAVRAVGSCG